jgi:hypothetical protein
MRMRSLLTCGTIAAACGLSPASAQPATSKPAAIERAFTPLNLKTCRHTRGKEPEDYGSWRWAGYAGIPVRVSAGDQRIYVSYGPRAASEPAARQTLASFNSEGSTIEWRIERRQGGKPRAFATILRWNSTVAQDSGTPYRGQMLVVTRLGPGGVCHVGYVDGRANANANELAAQIADSHARTFTCGRDKPMVLGERGTGFSGAYED